MRTFDEFLNRAIVFEACESIDSYLEWVPCWPIIVIGRLGFEEDGGERDRYLKGEHYWALGTKSGGGPLYLLDPFKKRWCYLKLDEIYLADIFWVEGSFKRCLLALYDIWSDRPDLWDFSFDFIRIGWYGKIGRATWSFNEFYSKS